MTDEQQRAIKDAIRAAYDAGYNHGGKDGNLSCSRYVGGNVEIDMGNRLIAQIAAPSQTDLHAAIMNISTDAAASAYQFNDPHAHYCYKVGHRDARHAAAELALLLR
jgi:hypothetical protein